jgi:hypothetical protein
MAGTVVVGPQKMALDLELLQVLTAGDTVGLAELLRREEQTNGHVAINVVQPSSSSGAIVPPLPGASCLLGVTSNGNTALHLVASRGHAELTALICERAPSLAATRNNCLDTPLHCAAKAGSSDVAACLLSKMRAGVDAETALRARNRAGATALYEAVRHGRAGVVDLLMSEAPELASLTTEEGFSPLYLAASIDSLQMVRSLLRPSQDGKPSLASFSGPEGRTVLHVAVDCIKGTTIERVRLVCFRLLTLYNLLLRYLELFQINSAVQFQPLILRSLGHKIRQFSTRNTSRNIELGTCRSDFAYQS